MGQDAASPAMSGFNIPPEVLRSDEFRKAAKVFVSPDGHAVRYLVQTDLNPFSTQAMDQVNAILLPPEARCRVPLLQRCEGVVVRLSGDTARHPGLLQPGFASDHRRDHRGGAAGPDDPVGAAVAPLYPRRIGHPVLSVSRWPRVLVFQFLLHQELHWSALD